MENRSGSGCVRYIHHELPLVAQISIALPPSTILAPVEIFVPFISNTYYYARCPSVGRSTIQIEQRTSSLKMPQDERRGPYMSRSLLKELDSEREREREKKQEEAREEQEQMEQRTKEEMDGNNLIPVTLERGHHHWYVIVAPRYLLGLPF